MGTILSTSGTRVTCILQKSGNIVTEIGELANHTRISCDRYVRQPYYQQSSRMVLPDISQEVDDLRIITTGLSYKSTNAPISGWGDETGKSFPGAFGYCGMDLSLSQFYQDQFATFTNGERINDEIITYALQNGKYYYPLDSIDNKIFGLPDADFNAYDLILLNQQHEYPSFYHVSLKREFNFVFHREIYLPLRRPWKVTNVYTSSTAPVFDTESNGTIEFIGDASPIFFYLDGFMYRKFVTVDKETTVLYRPTQDQTLSVVSPAAIMYSYTHNSVRSSALAANLSFIPDADTRHVEEKETENYRYAPLWFQWYRSAPLKMSTDVVFTDAKHGTYPTLGRISRKEPWKGCGTSFLSSGSPVTSMLIPLQLVWDANSDRFSPPSGFLTVYPYVNTTTSPPTLISHKGQQSRFPLVRFECMFERVESPTHVEVIPAANASKDGMDWVSNTNRLSYFPHIDIRNDENNLTPDVFLGAWIHNPDSEGIANNMPIMSRHVLFEGKLKYEDPWEILDVLELPFTYSTLPYPLYRLCYKRPIKHVRFTIMSIYMSTTDYPNTKYTHMYFPKIDFFTKPEN